MAKVDGYLLVRLMSIDTRSDRGSGVWIGSSRFTSYG